MICRPRSSKTVIPKSELDKIDKLYKNGNSARDIVCLTGLSYDQVRYRLRASGTPIRYNLVDTADLVRLYFSGLSITQVGERVSMSRECVRKRLVKAGVQMRPQMGRPAR